MESISTDHHSPAPVPQDGGQGSTTIHLSYMRRDLDELRRNQVDNFKAISETLNQIRDGHPTRAEFNEMREHVASKADDDQFVLLRKFCEEKLATKDDVAPMKTAYNRTIAIIMTAVIAAILGLILIK